MPLHNLCSGEGSHAAALHATEVRERERGRAYVCVCVYVSPTDWGTGKNESTQICLLSY